MGTIKNNKYLNYIAIFLSIFFICSALHNVVSKEMHKTLVKHSGEAYKDKYIQYVHSSMYAREIGIAISGLKYNLKGYVGYKKIFNLLYDSAISPQSFNESLSLDNVNSDGTYILKQSDLGIIDYYKISFLLFGYNIESFIYLYFILLSISVGLMLIHFNKYHYFV